MEENQNPGYEALETPLTHTHMSKYPSQDNLVSMQINTSEALSFHAWLDQQSAGRWTYGHSIFADRHIDTMTFAERAEYLCAERMRIYCNRYGRSAIVVNFRIVDLNETDVALLRMGIWPLIKYKIVGQERVRY